jgi:hypothetical protein
MSSVFSAVAVWFRLTHVAAFQLIQLVPSYVWALGVFLALLGIKVGKLDEIEGQIELKRVAHILRHATHVYLIFFSQFLLFSNCFQ